MINIINLDSEKFDDSYISYIKNIYYPLYTAFKPNTFLKYFRFPAWFNKYIVLENMKRGLITRPFKVLWYYYIDAKYNNKNYYYQSIKLCLKKEDFKYNKIHVNTKYSLNKICL